MTLSLIPCVLPSVPFFFSLVSLKSVCFNGVSGKFHGYFMKVSRKIEGCFEEGVSVLQGNFKCVSRKFQGCFKEV